MEKDDVAIREAFARIKKDMEVQSSRISEFESKNKKIERFMLDIKKELSELKQGIELLDKKNRETVEKREEKNVIATQMYDELDELKRGLKTVSLSQEFYSHLKKDVDFLKKEIALKNTSYKGEIKKTIKEVFEEIKRPTLKKEIMQRFDRNKKRILLQKILDMISERQLTLPELKTVVVDELRYCSKASFYRYFEQIKIKKMIDVVEYDGVNVLVLVKGKSER